MKASMISSVLIACAAGADVPLAAFGADDATTRTWKQQNDPVMGGKSSGTFTVSGDVGTMEGTVANVPSLSAPGFIKATASGTYSDVSSCTGISLEVQSTSNPDPYTGYRLSLGNDGSACGKFFARGYKANFAAPSGKFGTVEIPFEEFTGCWDDATGDAIKTCAEDSSVCISDSRKQNLQSVSVWAEGKLADVKLDIKSVRGYGCGSSVAEAPKVNIVELAESVDDLSTLVSAVVAADLADTLSSPGPFTVFAPTNEGFAALPEGTLSALMKPENKAQLVDILTFHVLPAQVVSTDLKFFQRVATVEGKNLHILKRSSGIHVGPDLQSLKKVVGADNLATNGVAHIIDGVMLPPAKLSGDKPNIVELAQSVDDLSTLVAAVVAADLVDTLSSPGPFTVFAPTNEAFSALPADTLDSLLKPENKDELVDILTYHVLPAQVLSKDINPVQAVATVEGKELIVTKDSRGVRVGPSFIDQKRVTAADNLASNGVAHIIDGVLLPTKYQGSKNIVELAQSVDDLSTLVAAVVAADLVETLSSPGPFTVFAPTNDAFGALPDGTLDSLLKPENKGQLTDILMFHVVPSQVLSTDLTAHQTVGTIEGKSLDVVKNEKGVFVGADKKSLVQVTAADNLASNGVAHIIDGVMLPPAGSVVV